MCIRDSNNTITWGSEVSFSNNQVQSHTTHAAFDAVNGKVVCFYGDAGDSNYGKVIVGQVSGTGASATITFGSPVDVLGAHLEHPSLCVVGGNYAVAANIEAALPNLLPESTQTDISVFVDAANLWHADYSSSVGQSSKIRSTVGVATNMFTPIGPLNFVLSQNLSKADSDQTESFRFQIGTSF